MIETSASGDEGLAENSQGSEMRLFVEFVISADVTQGFAESSSPRAKSMTKFNNTTDCEGTGALGESMNYQIREVVG